MHFRAILQEMTSSTSEELYHVSSSLWRHMDIATTE